MTPIQKMLQLGGKAGYGKAARKITEEVAEGATQKVIQTTAKTATEESIDRVGDIVKADIRRNSPSKLGKLSADLELEAANAEKSRIAEQINQRYQTQIANDAELGNNISDLLIENDNVERMEIQRGRLAKYAKDQEIYKTKNVYNELAEKLSNASETFEGTAATEELNAVTTVTMNNINEGRFFTSEFDRLPSNLKTSTGSMMSVTSSFTNPLINPVYNPAAFGTEQQALKAKLEAKHYAGKTADEIRYDKYMRKNAQYSGSNTEKAALEKQNTETQWSHGAKIVLGTAVTGAALCAALSSSRGQQNNAQLYGQQPLY